MNEIINYSEFFTLAGCDERWVLAYLRLLEEDGERRGLHVGTLLHIGLDRWNLGLGATLPREWTDDIAAGGKQGESYTRYLADFNPEHVALAQWLLARYEQHYGARPPSSWREVISEQWLSVDIGGGTTVTGRFDGLVYIEGDPDIPDGWWLLERKSYKSKGRLDYVHVDPQLVIYRMLVKATKGIEIMGVLFDGIYTYQWQPEKPTQAALIEAEIASNPGFTSEYVTKREQTEWAREAVKVHPGVERPAEESFQRRYVDITDAMVERGQQYLAAAVLRRAQLRENPELALPNVGMACKMCGFKDDCWARLRGAEEYEIEIDDPEAEPV